MAGRAAQPSDFGRLSEGDQQRYEELLRMLDRLRLGCRCEVIDGKDFTVVVGKGYATARYWLETFNLS
jgi:hypothetical protein